MLTICLHFMPQRQANFIPDIRRPLHSTSINPIALHSTGFHSREGGQISESFLNSTDFRGIVHWQWTSPLY